MQFKKFWIIALPLAFAFGGCDRNGPAEDAGEKVDEALEKTGEKAEEAAEETGKAAEKAKEKAKDATD